MNLHMWLSKQEVSLLQWTVAMQVHDGTEQHTAACATAGRREVLLKVLMKQSTRKGNCSFLSRVRVFRHKDPRKLLICGLGFVQ